MSVTERSSFAGLKLWTDTVLTTATGLLPFLRIGTPRTVWRARLDGALDEEERTSADDESTASSSEKQTREEDETEESMPRMLADGATDKASEGSEDVVTDAEDGTRETAAATAPVPSGWTLPDEELVGPTGGMSGQGEGGERRRERGERETLCVCVAQ